MSGNFAFGWNTPGRQGFTLLELLVIVAILAAVAFVAGSTFLGVREQANDQLVHTEMQEIAKAIRRFRQDTGYYPKTGPFDLQAYGGSVPYTGLPASAGSDNAARDLWFYSPANFHQLLSRTSPLNGTGHQLASWDPETGRGWRGPYLQGHGDGFLDIRDGINSGTTPAGSLSGDPLAGNNVPDVEGVADPFEHRAVNVGGDTLLDWSATANGAEREVWGRPYLVFGLDASPRIVSMGPDGVYGTDDDIILNIE